MPSVFHGEKAFVGHAGETFKEALPMGAGGMFLRRYESLFILNPELAQDKMEEVVEKFQHIITRDNGRILRTDSIGLRKLSFDIKRQSRGFYVLLDYAGEPKIIKELERNFRIDERVLNYQTIKLNNTITEEDIEAIMAQKPTQPPEPEEAPEKSLEQDAALEATSDQEEADQQDIDKMDAPHPEEHADKAESEQTGEEP
jgi:small subunit ribosomal protein S6